LHYLLKEKATACLSLSLISPFFTSVRLWRWQSKSANCGRPPTQRQQRPLPLSDDPSKTRQPHMTQGGQMHCIGGNFTLLLIILIKNQHLK
jgi:hypothetical protein